jgi:hypothetical protein
MALQDKITEARVRVAGYVAENQTGFGEKLSRAERAANNQTKDRYQQQLAKGRRKAEEVIAKLAQPPS